MMGGKHVCKNSRIGHILVVIGAINWGIMGVGSLFGMGDWNVVHMLLGSIPMLEAVVYVLVGVAGVMELFGCKCKACCNGAAA